MMNLKAFLVLILAIGVQAKGPAFVSKSVVMDLRGGGAIGPLDQDSIVPVAKVAASAYVAGSAVKYISNLTGATSPKVSQDIIK